jgi:hypothetical protein
MDSRCTARSSAEFTNVAILFVTARPLHLPECRVSIPSPYGILRRSAQSLHRRSTATLHSLAPLLSRTSLIALRNTFNSDR